MQIDDKAEAIKALKTFDLTLASPLLLSLAERPTNTKKTKILLRLIALGFFVYEVRKRSIAPTVPE